ncbi:MAG: DUF5788 family protein [Halodesulfurarchaeum sp.]
MRDYERERYLERIERDGATVGVEIPERIEIDGTEMPLRTFVFEVKTLDAVPPKKQESVAEMRTAIRRARRKRKRKLEGAALSSQEAERLVDEIVGLDRALNALASLGPTDVESAIEAREVADQKRWLSFLDTVLGRDRSGTNRRSRRR